MSEWVGEIDYGALPPVIDHLDLPAAVDEAGGLAEALTRLLGEIDTALLGSTLDDRMLVDAIMEEERLSRVHAARRTRLIAELHRRRPGDEPGITSEDDTPMQFPVSRWAPDELGLALSMSRLTAKNTLREAARLAAVLPDTLVAFEQGLIDSYRARIIHDTTLCLPDELARQVEALVLADAGEQTYAQLRAAVRAAVMRVDPEGANQRHQQERKKRLVDVYAEEEGMAALRALMPATEAQAIWHLLTRLARSIEDERTLDQRRADLVVDLLRGRLILTDLDPDPDSDADSRPGPESPSCGSPSPGSPSPGSPSPRSPTSGSPTSGESTGAGAARPRWGEGSALVQVVVGMETLNGTSQQPGYLTGYGPIPADLAREAALDGVWRRLVTDPQSGVLLDHGRATYRPPAGLADFVRARDQVCRHPICSRRAVDSELDHVVRWADGGVTSAGNVVGHCRQHNLLKEQAGWSVLAHPDGTITWVTPTGHEHTSRPQDFRPYSAGPEPPDRAGPAAVEQAAAEDEPPF